MYQIKKKDELKAFLRVRKKSVLKLKPQLFILDKKSAQNLKKRSHYSIIKIYSCTMYTHFI